MSVLCRIIFCEIAIKGTVFYKLWLDGHALVVATEGMDQCFLACIQASLAALVVVEEYKASLLRT